MQLYVVATSCQRGRVGRMVVMCTQQLCDKGNKCARVYSVTSTCVPKLALSLGQLGAKLTSRRSLLLKQEPCRSSRCTPSPSAHQSLWNMATPKQHDHDVQILADVFATCSAKLQSPLNAWLGRSVVFSLGTWPSKPTKRVAVHQGENSFKLLPPC